MKRRLLVVCGVFLVAPWLAGQSIASCQPVDLEVHARSFGRETIPFVILNFWQLRNEITRGEGRALEDLFRHIRVKMSANNLDAMKRMMVESDSPVDFALAITSEETTWPTPYEEIRSPDPRSSDEE